MGDVVNLNAKSLTPEQVLEAALEEKTLTHAYIVLVHEDGAFDVRSSGDLSKMATAALFLSDYALAHARGEIESV